MRSMLIFGLTIGFTLGLSSEARAVGTEAGTVISNQAYGDYKDANGNSLTRVFSNTVQTTVSQVASPRVEPPTASKTGTAGTDVVYAVTVHNDGNDTDTFDLTAATTDTLAANWTTKIYLDLNEDGVLDAADIANGEITDTGALDADEVAHLLVVASVPAGAATTTVGTTTLTATSQNDNGEVDTGTYTTTPLTAVLDIVKSATPTNPQPGDTVTYAITGKNTGTAKAVNIVVNDVIPTNMTYVAGSIRLGPIGGTYATAAVATDADDNPDANITPSRATYNSGATRVELIWPEEEPFSGAGDGGVLYFQATVNALVLATTTIENIATATFQLEGLPTDYNTTSNESAVTVANDPAVTLDPDRSSSADPGDQVVYQHTLTNAGNVADTYDLTYTSTAGWTWALWKDTNEDGIPGNDGDVLLTDTDGDGTIDSGELAKGATLPVLAVATVPAGTSDGTVDTAVFTATSSVDTNVKDTATDTTTVTAPVIKLTKTVTPTGNQPPGTELTYTVEAENTGSGTATVVVIADVVPDFTTYKANSILTGSSVATLTARSDSSNGDGGTFDAGSDAVLTDSASLGTGGKLFLRFTVTID